MSAFPSPALGDFWKTLRESQARQPDSGKPTVRDENGGLGKRDLWSK